MQQSLVSRLQQANPWLTSASALSVANQVADNYNPINYAVSSFNRNLGDRISTYIIDRGISGARTFTDTVTSPLRALSYAGDRISSAIDSSLGLNSNPYASRALYSQYRGAPNFQSPAAERYNSFGAQAGRFIRQASSHARSLRSLSRSLVCLREHLKELVLVL